MRYTTHEATLMLGLLPSDTSPVVAMVKRGDLEGVKVGRHWMVESESIERYLLDRMGAREIAAASQKATLLEAEVRDLREVAGGAHTPHAKQRRRAIRSEWELAQGRRVRGHVSRRVRWLVMERDGHRCVYCGATPGDEVRLVIDHRIPFADGGTSDPDNLVTACEDCNVGKQDTPLVEERSTPAEKRTQTARLVGSGPTDPREAGDAVGTASVGAPVAHAQWYSMAGGWCMHGVPYGETWSCGQCTTGA